MISGVVDQRGFFGRLLSLTPGPSPSPPINSTPTASSARWTAATLFGKPAACPSLASIRRSVGTETFAAVASSLWLMPASVRPAAI